MKKKTITKLKEIKEYLQQNYPNGDIVINYAHLIKPLGFSSGSSVRYHMELLVKEGFLELISPPILKNNKWQPAEYKIAKRSYPTFDYVNGQQCLSLEKVAEATKFNVEFVKKVIGWNKELFENLFVDVNHLNKNGVLAYIMKINMSKVSPVKKEEILKFQKYILHSMKEKSISLVKPTTTKKKRTYAEGNVDDIISDIKEKLVSADEYKNRWQASEERNKRLYNELVELRNMLYERN